jgi:hypothetical protein
MTKSITPLLVIVVLAVLTPPAGADSPIIGIEANSSFWFTIYEEVENGLIQPGSGDPAADHASGFNFKLGRVALTFESPDRKIEALIRLRLEERTDVISFWGAYHAAPWLGAYIGQMKIPSTAEVLAPDHLLDFTSRTTFGRNVCDYSLSRTPYISSIMAAKSYDRDLGFALKGLCPGRKAPSIGYFIMASNGIGANRYIGGDTSEEFLYTNGFGDFYYGARLELSPASMLTLGTHLSMNRHDDMALGDRGPVYDIDRRVWTADSRLELPTGQRIEGFYGIGSMNDFIESQNYRFDYSGWGLWAIQPLVDGKIELGIRYDNFTYEFNEDGNKTSQNNLTAGVNYRPEEYLRLQLNYIYKQTVNEFEEDLDDNILYLNVQFIFDAMLME